MKNALVHRAMALVGRIAIMLVASTAIGYASGETEGMPVDYTKELIGVDLIRVTFHENSASRKKVAEARVSIPSEIDQFITDFKGKTASCYKCGYDGQIEFLNRNLTVRKVDFNLECRQVASDNGCWNMDDVCVKRLEDLRSTALKGR